MQLNIGCGFAIWFFVLILPFSSLTEKRDDGVDLALTSEENPSLFLHQRYIHELSFKTVFVQKLQNFTASNSRGL